MEADFGEWHNPDGAVSEKKLAEAYEIYKSLFTQGGKDYADDKICGHPVWEGKEKEEEMKTKIITYSIIEDNGGGLHLVVFSNNRAIYAHTGYEFSRGQLINDLDNLDSGGHPVMDGWEGGEDNPAAFWAEISGHMIAGDYGYNIVADNDNSSRTIYVDRMGAAARLEFEITE